MVGQVPAVVRPEVRVLGHHLREPGALGLRQAGGVRYVPRQPELPVHLEDVQQRLDPLHRRELILPEDFVVPVGEQARIPGPSGREL
jgi:hypothetical protein